MKLPIGTLIKKYMSTADTYQKKGAKEWAKAKNGDGGEHYQRAKQAYETARVCREKAEQLQKQNK